MPTLLVVDYQVSKRENSRQIELITKGDSICESSASVLLVNNVYFVSILQLAVAGNKLINKEVGRRISYKQTRVNMHVQDSSLFSLTLQLYLHRLEP